MKRTCPASTGGRKAARVNRTAVLLAVMATGLLGLGSAFAHPGATVQPAQRAQTTGTARCPSASGHEVVQTIPLPGRSWLRSMVVVNKTLWIAIGSPRLGGRGKLLRADVRSGRVQRVFRLAGDPWSIKFGFGSLWMTGDGGGFGGAVMRIDPRSGGVVSVIRAHRRFGGRLATTSDGVWVAGE